MEDKEFVERDIASYREKRDKKSGVYFQETEPGKWTPVIKTDKKSGKKFAKIGPKKWAPVAGQEEETFLGMRPSMVGQEMIENAPGFGGIIGGAAGGPAGAGLGALAGAAYREYMKNPPKLPEAPAILGSQLGHWLKGEEYEGPEPDLNPFSEQTIPHTVKTLARDVPEVAMEAMMGPAGSEVNYALKKPREMVDEAIAFRDAQRPSQEVLEAAKRQEVPLTGPMMTGREDLIMAEQQLAQSPGLTPWIARSAIRGAYKKAVEPVEKLVEKFPEVPLSETGQILKDNLKKLVDNYYAPAVEVYKRYQDDYLRIPVDPDAIETMKRSLARQRYFRFNKGKQVKNEWLAEFMDEFETMNISVADLREARTELWDRIQASEGIERKRLKAIYNQLTFLRNASIETAAERGIKTKADPKEILDQTILADGVYAEAGNRLKEAFKMTGKDMSERDEFYKYLDRLNEKDLATAFSHTKRAQAFRKLKEESPEAFEAIKNQKFGEILKRSQGPNGTISMAKFRTNWRGLDAAEKDILFDKDLIERLDDIVLMAEAWPERINPSGTGRFIEYSKSRGPVEWLWKEVSQNLPTAVGLYGGRQIDRIRDPILKGMTKPGEFLGRPLMYGAQGMAGFMGGVADSMLPQETFEVPEEEKAAYIQDVMKDKNLDNVAKMKRIRLLREEGLGVAEQSMQRDVASPQIQPTIDTSGAAQILKGGR